MFVYLDSQASECLAVLSREIGLSKADCVRFSLADAGAFFLGRPGKYIILERAEWKATLDKIKVAVKRQAKKIEQTKRHLVEAAKN